MTPIRVLQVFTTMGRGGAESMIMNYYRNIDRTKVQFDFLVHRQERAAFDDEIEQMGGVIYRMPAINPINPKKYYKALRAFFNTHNTYKIVHSHLNTFSTFPLKIAEEYKIPTRIAHAHIAMDPITLKHTLKSIPNTIEALKKVVKLYVKRTIHKHTTHSFACGKKAGTWLYGKNAQFHIMNNAISAHNFAYDIDKESELKKNFNIQDKIVLGHIGRFTHQKNHTFLIDILADVLVSNKNYVLVLIGDGPLKQNTIEKAKKLHIFDQILFLGLKTNISELIQMIDVFVFPSLYEGLPVTLVEAQAAGLKILASNNITEEVKLTEDIQFLPITEGTTPWVNALLKLDKITKNKNFDKIVAGNYDIINNSNEIQNFYLTQNTL